MTLAEPVRGLGIHELVLAQCRARPGSLAVRCDGDELSYAGLDRRSARLAGALRQAGVARGDLVLICLPRGISWVVATLAVLRAGAGFVPVDPHTPRYRFARVMSDAMPRAVLTSRCWSPPPGGVPDHCRVIVAEGEEAVSWPTREVDQRGPVDAEKADEGDIAYVLYTSGSSGWPKGVMVTHGSVVAFIEAVTSLLALTAEDRVVAYASCSFDVSVFDIFGSLANGASLYVATDEERMNPARLQRLLESAAITVGDLPPAVLALLRSETLPDLRLVFVGGEAYPGELVNRWNTTRRFVNGYGPTECTVTVATFECEGSWTSSPPIGKAIDRHRVHVVDDRLELVPRGTAGELVVSGPGLALGYLGCPRQTAEVFVPDPFGSAPGSRLYRTGDLVVELESGDLRFLGRLDRQAKINGVRIELGEIESVLASLDMISQAHVRVVSSAGRGQRLLAYVTPAETSVDEGLMRRELKQRLPVAMIPAHVIVLDQMPLTVNGKLDERALPEPLGAW